MLPSATDDPFAQFKVTFFEECNELLASTEQSLADLESGSYESDTLHAIFRAVHSMKAGAGAFSFDRMVAFTHKFENLLDELREGRLEVNEKLVETLFRGFDVVADLVGFAQSGDAPAEDFGQDVLEDISAFLSDGGGTTAAADVASGAASSNEDAGGTWDMLDSSDANSTENSGGGNGGSDDSGSSAGNGMQHFRIEFTPKEAMYRHANEPLLIIRELRELGEMETTIDTSRVPCLISIEPEDAYFSWVFDLKTKENRDEIDEVFEFVIDDCDLTIVTLDSADCVVSVDVSPCRGSDTDDDFGFFVDDEDLKKGIASAIPEHQAPIEAETVAKGTIAPTSAPVVPDAPTAAVASVSGTPKTTSIRVDVERVDKLVNMVGELVITQSMLTQEVESSNIAVTSRVGTGMAELSMHIRELQENVMAIRMQPVKSVFSRMPRIVRDVSKKLGKKVKLVTIGENTEVDKTVIEELADPLTHMIRNSLDHGLETPDERVAAGKPEEGVITLSAEHRGGRIIIQIVDDGRGINRAKVYKLAKEKGVIAEDADLSDEEIDNLIFAPGFSTADEVTDLSGRGVGMDVVRRNIQSLGGRVSVHSDPGKGTTFRLTLPLTLAVLDGMIVGVAGTKFVIPISNIIETVRPTERDVSRLVDGNMVVHIRGEYIRIAPTARIFELTGGEDDPTK
ncbi:MAG: chemotaxis protein CheA, partial [Kordiimonadaceae bacterium]|nr:chemotaxis protein CheA [Kordiimonadaceae bacterium]